jgi:uncharacterized protein with HEPN domain
VKRKSDLRLADYLDHMAQAIERIQRYTANMTVEAFALNSLVQDAVIRNLEIIGEAARNVEREYPEFAAAHPDVPWEDMYLMRNRVSHGYFAVDTGVVWQTLIRDLPELQGELARIRPTQ